MQNCMKCNTMQSVLIHSNDLYDPADPGLVRERDSISMIDRIIPTHDSCILLQMTKTS